MAVDDGEIWCVPRRPVTVLIGALPRFESKVQHQNHYHNSTLRICTLCRYNGMIGK